MEKVEDLIKHLKIQCEGASAEAQATMVNLVHLGLIAIYIRALSIPSRTSINDIMLKGDRVNFIKMLFWALLISCGLWTLIFWAILKVY